MQGRSRVLEKSNLVHNPGAGSRAAVGLGFLVLSAGSLIQIIGGGNLDSVVAAVVGILLIVAGRNYFTHKQKRTVYFGVVLYFVLLGILILGFTGYETSLFDYFSSSASQLASSISGKSVSASQLDFVLLPYLAINYGICYYLLSYRLIRGVLHIGIGIIILVSVFLRIFAVYIENYPGLVIGGVKVGSILISIGALVDLPISVLMSTIAIIILTLVLFIVAMFVFLRKPSKIKETAQE